MTLFIHCAPLAAMLALAGLAGSAAAETAPAKPAPEYVSIVQEIAVNAPVDVVMKKTDGFCDIAAWFKATCTYTVGSGGIGTNRLIAGRINEVMVAKTATSYTYAQPLAPNSYHGTVEYQPAPGGSKIIYSLFYDASLLPDQAAKDRDRASRAKMFMGVLEKMKAIAEAP
jgi:hypothetical protein